MGKAEEHQKPDVVEIIGNVLKLSPRKEDRLSGKPLMRIKPMVKEESQRLKLKTINEV